MVPVLAGRMQVAQCSPVIDDLVPHPFAQNREEWLERSAHAVILWVYKSFICFNSPFNKFEVCKWSPAKRCQLSETKCM